MTVYLEKFFTEKLYRDLLFFFIVFFSIFNFIPEKVQIGLLGGAVSSKLVTLPLFLLIFFSLYSQYKYGNIFKNYSIFKRYFFAYLIGLLLSLIMGVYYYPYLYEIISGPLITNTKLSTIIKFFNNHNIFIQQNTLAWYYYVLWDIKEVITLAFWTFGGSYLIYCLFYDDWKKCFELILKGIFSSLVIICIYSVIEIFYLAGNEYAANILTVINPYIHIIESSYGWWPPLLLKGQLRSVFEEPSHFGIWASFAIPFVWYVIFKVKKIGGLAATYFVWFFLSFCLFLSNARTVLAIFLFELFLISFLMLYLYRKVFIKKVVLVILVTAIAFSASNYFQQNLLYYNTYKISSVEEYLKTNVTSIVSSDSRSNTARYSVALAHLKIGMAYPLFGVGYNLSNSYIKDYLPEMAENSGEVKMWLKLQDEKGLLKSGFPKLGEWTSRFSETGIINLFIYLLPIMILLNKLGKKILHNNEQKLPYIMFLISFLGMLITGFSNILNITYCYWILLGLGYAMCFGKENDVKYNDDTGSRQEH